MVFPVEKGVEPGPSSETKTPVACPRQLRFTVTTHLKQLLINQ